MSTQPLRKALKDVSIALLAASFSGVCCMAHADSKKPPSAPAKSAPAPRSAPAAKPAGNSGSASHGAGATHGPTATGSAAHGPSASGAGGHGPTANGANARTTSSPTANGGSIHGANGATTGAHTAGAGGGGAGTHATTAGGAGAHTAAASHSPIKSAAPKGSNEHIARTGSAVRTRPNGKVSDVHDAKRGMDVHHGLNGNRRVSVVRADHSRVFAERGRRGYVERGYNYHGREFARRSYYYNGRAYDRYYHGYYRGGVYMNVYAPGYYYAPAFYGWAYNPWAAPITWGWGWGGSPWYGYYGYYFNPYPVYPSAAFWLTDYMISASLQAAFAAHQEAGEAAGDPPPTSGGSPAMTPEVKQMIADEVKAQLALENQEAQQNAQQKDVDPASSGITRLLSDGHPHVFVAGDGVDVVDANGQECAISDGDALRLQAAPPADATEAQLVVLSSKGGKECPRSSTVTVQVSDLQEMQNHMRETIDQGLQDLKEKQGKGGLPAAPPSAQGQPSSALYASAAPLPETNAAKDIQQQTQEADQAEKEVTAEVMQDNGTPVEAATAAAPAAMPAPAAPTATVALGQTPDEVKSALGAPAKIANLGPKVIYYYNGMKVTFKGGKVSDVE